MSRSRFVDVEAGSGGAVLRAQRMQQKRRKQWNETYSGHRQRASNGSGSGLDAVRNVGIRSGKIAVISSDPLEGKQTIDARAWLSCRDSSICTSMGRTRKYR